MRKPFATLALFATLLATTPAHADDWTPEQRLEGAALAALHVIAWGQQRQMSSHPAADPAAVDGSIPNPAPIDRRYAAQCCTAATAPASAAPAPAVGADLGKINRQYLAGALIGAVMLDALPSAWRDPALKAGLVLEAGVVANRLRLGVGIRF
jgi:hypothetical protein